MGGRHTDSACALLASPQLDTGTLELRDLTLDAAYLNALLVRAALVCLLSAVSH